MVDPNPACARKDERVSAPHIRGVEVRDLDVLDDDIGHADEAQTLADEFGGCAEANKCLVRLHVDSLNTSRVDLDVAERKAVAAAQPVEHTLAAGRRHAGVREACLGCGRALRAPEVKRPADHDVLRSFINGTVGVIS